ncbi:dentin sialophosphoprotein [Camponotus floridanus]|uniref:dentin sialophosphoprotein n=1 Tax=Camponotus floridanus TaxID=104421 RepID=UPI000DC6C3FF|nr:dentin sialophosphoprotein [Camponotus floridanus]
MSKIREYIMYYLELKKKLDIAAARVVNEKRNLENTATDYGLPQKFLKQKVDILRRLNNYFEETLLYDNAIRSVMYNYKTLLEAATYYNLNPEDIKKEINQYNILLKNNKTKGPYEYDKPLDKERIFTFKEELSLMDDLRQWKYKNQSLCTCLICAMVQLVSLAYQSAREKNKKYLPEWDMYQQADRDWLVIFEMTHSSRLSQLYQYDTVQELYETCMNKQLDETYKNKQPSSLVLSDEKNIFKALSSTHSISNPSSRKRKHNIPKKINQLNLDETTTQTSRTATSTISQNDTLTDRDKIASGNILQKENSDSSQAYNQNTSELRNLNALMEQKSEVMSENQTASASFATNQFQNGLSSNQFQLLDSTNKYQDILTDRDKIASDNILQKENSDSSQAYNQNTSELRNLNALMEQKSEVMSENQTASASFATNQFQNGLSSNQFQLLDSTNKYQDTLTDHDKIASGNILQKDDSDSSQAYNQNTSELRNLNALMEQKSDVMSENQIASASFATNQFQNGLSSNQFQLPDSTNKYQDTLTDHDKIASGNILQKDNFDSSQAYNQNTNELENLNAHIKQKLKIMFTEQTFASLATNEFQNDLASKQNLNYLIPQVNIEKSINDISKKKIQSIANMQLSKEE